MRQTTQPVPRTPPLAIDAEGNPFQLDRSVIAYWHVRRVTGGRPANVWRAQSGVVRLELDADYEQLRHAVANKPGEYLLYPCDATGTQHKPVAHVEVVAGDPVPVCAIEPERSAPLPVEPTAGVATEHEMVAQFIRLYERHLQSHERMIKASCELALATAAIQHSTAKLLDAMADSVRIANGRDALDRIGTSWVQ